MRRVLPAACWIGICVALIYLPDCGRGFLKDDYGWITSSQLDGWSSLWRILRTAPMGFFRPITSLSFGLNHLLFGLHPLPYGLTNFSLAVLTALAIGRLILSLGFESGAALAAASVWILNFHGINTAILWTSGRTSLLGTLFAVCAASAFVRSRPIACGLLTLLALLSKEEPLLLPMVFAVWTAIDRRLLNPQAKDVLLRTRIFSVAAAAIAAGVYLLMRSNTGALTVATAPDFYRYRPSTIPANTLQYLDRSLTLPVALLILGALVARPARVVLTTLERATVIKGAVWLVCGFALTIMIPVRSSLYVCLPSVGSSLMFGAVGSALWRGARRPQLMLAALVLPVAFLPVYWARNAELGKEQRLAVNTLHVVGERLATGSANRLVIYDNLEQHPSINDAFGTHLPDAVQLVAPSTQPRDIVISTTPPTAVLAGPRTLEFVLSGTSVVERRAR